jgi:hypothetical protein
LWPRALVIPVFFFRFSGELLIKADVDRGGHMGYFGLQSTSGRFRVHIHERSFKPVRRSRKPVALSQKSLVHEITRAVVKRDPDVSSKIIE